MFDQKKDLPIARLTIPEAQAAGVELYVLRLDQTDARVSGNKWFKLKYNLREAQRQRNNTVLSFGGAYSNHIHALAWAGKQLGIQTVGIIRGEPAYAANPTLQDAARWGMKLIFVNRSEYRRRHDDDYLNELQVRFGDVFIVPEGGSNRFAVEGAAEIVTNEMVETYQITDVVLPCGTGGTLAGVAVSQPSLNVLGIPVLKKAEFLLNDIDQLLRDSSCARCSNWSLDFNGHFGGYAKVPTELLEFISEIRARYNLPLEQIYTGKMLFRLIELIKMGRFQEGSRILAIHTGGLQGLRSLTGA